jgi:hypothetical protein
MLPSPFPPRAARACTPSSFIYSRDHRVPSHPYLWLDSRLTVPTRAWLPASFFPPGTLSAVRWRHLFCNSGRWTRGHIQASDDGLPTLLRLFGSNPRSFTPLPLPLSTPAFFPSPPRFLLPNQHVFILSVSREVSACSRLVLLHEFHSFRRSRWAPGSATPGRPVLHQPLS